MSHGDIETVYVEGKWHNAIAGSVDQVSEPFDTQEEAAAEGREMARESRVDHVIKNIDGTVLERNSYGEDRQEDQG